MLETRRNERSEARRLVTGKSTRVTPFGNTTTRTGWATMSGDGSVSESTRSTTAVNGAMSSMRYSPAESVSAAIAPIVIDASATGCSDESKTPSRLSSTNTVPTIAARPRAGADDSVAE